MSWNHNTVDCVCLFVGFKHPNCLRSSLPKINFSFKCDAVAWKNDLIQSKGNFLLISCQIPQYLSCAFSNNNFCQRIETSCNQQMWDLNNTCFQDLGILWTFSRAWWECHTGYHRGYLPLDSFSGREARSKNFSNTGMIWLRNSRETWWLISLWVQAFMYTLL